MDLSSLNKYQKEAVLTTDGPIMVLAGAGSGKTRTLVSKVNYLLKEKRVSPYKILAVTFSNKAAKEMRERVAAETPYERGALQITTFHSFCAQVLRSEARYLGLSRNFTIYDNAESRMVIKAVLNKRGISLKEISPYDVLDYIDELKNAGFYLNRKEYPYDVEEDDIFFHLYKDYEAEIHKSNAVDFGGLIIGVVELFEKYPEVLERFQRRYDYVLVDEYQDTNRAQFDLVRHLSSLHKNICVVGDEDQSIYSWRGANIHNILDFEEVFPKAKIFKLEQNYRSSRNIIEAASHVISKNSMRKDKKMWTDNDIGESINIVECNNEKSEAEFIARKIKEFKDSGERLSDAALFYRNNSQSRVLEDALRKYQLAYRIIGGIKFYERKEIKDLIAYMRLIVNPKDSLALSRIINVPARGIGATSLRKLEDEAIKLNQSLWDVVDSICTNGEEFEHIKLSRKIRSSLSELHNLISEVQVLNENKESPAYIYEKLLHESGYYNYIKAYKDYEALSRLENLEELQNAISQFEEDNEIPTLLGFLETVTLDTSVDNEDEDQSGAVSLMTIHGSKGLEFPYVFLTGAEENIFPSYRSLDENADGLEEERRLFYVAMTRAMKKLYISFAQARMLFGSLKFNGPSRFIHEIPSDYYEWINKSHEGSKPKSLDGIDYGDEYSQDTYEDGSNTYVQSESIVKATFPKGCYIVHGLYGEGQVIETDGHGQDEKVIIKFKDGAKKKFMVKFAPLVLL